MKQVIATMHLYMFLNCCWVGLSELLRVQGKLEPSPQESGTVSKQPVYIIGEIIVVHDVKTRVASNHKMKCIV